MNGLNRLAKAPNRHFGLVDGHWHSLLLCNLGLNRVRARRQQNNEKERNNRGACCNDSVHVGSNLL